MSITLHKAPVGDQETINKNHQICQLLLRKIPWIRVQRSGDDSSSNLHYFDKDFRIYKLLFPERQTTSKTCPLEIYRLWDGLDHREIPLAPNSTYFVQVLQTARNVNEMLASPGDVLEIHTGDKISLYFPTMRSCCAVTFIVVEKK